MNAYVKERHLIDRKSIVAAAVGMLLVAMLLVTLLVAQPVRAASGTVIKKTTLSGSNAYPGVSGEATWKATAGQRELEVEIKGAQKLAGKRLEVRIGGKLVGHITVSALGRARLEKHTEKGQRVPASVAGKAVKVRTSAGALVASGRLVGSSPPRELRDRGGAGLAGTAPARSTQRAEGDVAQTVSGERVSPRSTRVISRGSTGRSPTMS